MEPPLGHRLDVDSLSVYMDITPEQFLDLEPEEMETILDFTEECRNKSAQVIHPSNKINSSMSLPA